MGQGTHSSVHKTWRDNRWLIGLSVVIAGIAVAMAQNKVSPVMNMIITQFHTSASVAGWISSSFSLIAVLLSMTAANLADSIGIRKVGIFALIITVVGGLLGMFSTNIWFMLLTRVIEGTGVGIIAVIGPVLITQWFNSKNGLSIIMAIWTSWMTISQVIIFFTASPITSSFSWQGMWGLAIAFLIVGFIAFLLFVHQPQEIVEEHENRKDNRSTARKVLDSINIKTQFKAIKAAGKSSAFIGIAAFFFALCSFTFVSWIQSVWVQNVPGLSRGQINTMLSSMYFLEIFFTILAGVVLDKIKSENGKKIFGMSCAVLYGVIGLAAFNFIHTTALAWSIIIIFPIFDGSIPTTIYSLAPMSVKKAPLSANAIGIMNIGLNAGTFFAAPLAGSIMNMGSSMVGVMFIVSAILVALAFGFVTLYEGK
ncbi:MFS transporter [Lactobacillus sp. ESL0679]|uniref:MFS transporter n=1 Tax=Lactobacillus sp. ESL0679 TaxID=2983209 RepID=UPI0023F8EB64|nr:MFS transporter [Lactobacillus sp. ESL0679]MDF7682180.1 MFS transporter [Lactobacillus sp. ESL0679]